MQYLPHMNINRMLLNACRVLVECRIISLIKKSFFLYWFIISAKLWILVLCLEFDQKPSIVLSILSICLSINCPIYTIYMSIDIVLSIHTIYMSIYQLTYLYNLYVYLSINLSLNLLVHPSDDLTSWLFLIYFENCKFARICSIF